MSSNSDQLSYSEVAKKIIEAVGGKENINAVNYCMTRLRLGLNDLSKARKDELKKIDDVLGVVELGDQLQIVLSPGKVVKIVNYVGEISGISVGEMNEAKARSEELKAKNSTPFKLLLKRISNIFIPLIPAFIACGLVLGIDTVILDLYPNFTKTTIGGIFWVIGEGVFYGLNLFVGFNAAKEFGGTPIIGGTMAAIISMPDLGNVILNGQKLLPGRGGVIAVLLVVAFSSWLEKRVRKIVPDMLDLFITPLLTVLISAFVAIFILQPIGGIISDAIGTAVQVSVNKGGPITGFILGGTYLPLVMTGLHQSLIPVYVNLLKTTGQDVLNPILTMAGAGQVGAALAILVKTKNTRLKKTICSSLPVGILGIGEPLIYGVTLPLGKPFIGACIGGAFGGAFNAVMKIGALSFGLSGLPLALVIKSDKILLYLVGMIIAYIAGFIATMLLGFDDPVENS